MDEKYKKDWVISQSFFDVGKRKEKM